MLFTNYMTFKLFSLPLGCLLTFLIVSLAAQKFSTKMKANVCFSSVACGFGIIFIKCLCNLTS